MDALALIESPGHVCCRYRLEPFRAALEARGHTLVIEPLAREPVVRAKQLAGSSRYDLVILQRKLLSTFELCLLRAASNRLVYDFDDAVFARDSYDARGHACSRRRRRFSRVVRMADRVVAGNEFLLSRAILAGASPENTGVVPTCIDPELYLPARLETRGSGGPARLVWIGSSSTLQGLEEKIPLWDRLAREVPGLSLRLICDRFPNLGRMPIEPLVWSEESEAAFLADSDVGISWVPDDVWSRGKCGLKVLQYMAAGIPVVANPVGVHIDMIEPGRTGYLPSSDEEWVCYIQALVGDRELRVQMGREARARAQARYSVASWADRWVDLVFGERERTRPTREGSVQVGKATSPHFLGNECRLSRPGPWEGGRK